MNFTVLWTPTAEQRLAALWLDPTHRAAVSRAANEIDQRLQRDAPHLGESRGGARRVFFEPPLGVTYEVDQARQIVFVLYVWRFRPGRRQP